MNSLSLAWRLARRELRSGLSGFRIFFACLVLGVAAIAGVDSIADALLAGLAEHGRVLLGGDVAVELVHRSMSATERGFVAARGASSETISMRAMAYANGANAARQLIELKAVDKLYPLYGSVGLSPAIDFQKALACTPTSGSIPKHATQNLSWPAQAGHPVGSDVRSPLGGPVKPGHDNFLGFNSRNSTDICGAVVEQSFLDRLGSARGGLMRIGNQSFRIAAILTDEPDRLSGGFSLGPHAIISTAALDRTGLVTTGSLINYTTRVKLPANASIAAFRREARARFPDAGWQIRDRDHAAPGTDRFIRQVSVFLTLVGLTALAVGGVGAGQAARAFIDRKREEIATLRALGADGNLIFLTFFLQAMAIAALAALTGLVLGAAIPFAVERLYGAELPVPASFRIFPGPLALAFVFGMLSAAAFAIPPLARAREIAPAGLFRDLVAPAQKRGRLPYLAAAAGAALLIVALALAVSPSRAFTLWFLAGAAGGFVALRLAAAGLRFLLRRLPAASRPAPRLALANMTRPGSPTDSVIVALGLGLSLLAAVTLLDRTISAQVNDSLPESAPTFFFVDIQPQDAAAFDSTIARFASTRDYRRTPMIRGRITALNHVPAAKAKVATESRWALSGDRGITYAGAEPKDADIASGRWWPANYKGPTLISFDAELAEGMGLKVGDSVTLNVLGREIEGRIANLRHVDFSNGRQNFILILSPGIIDKAPHSFLATVRVAPHDEDALYRAVTDRFHSVSTVRVRDVIAQLDKLLGQLAFGVRAASLVTILAGLLVLAGAIAAGQRARLYDSTVMKVVGATRSQIALVYGIEYALVGVLTGALALGAGTAAAWLVTRRVFDVHLVFDWRAVLLTVAGGAVATLLFGFATSWTALAARPAAQLRNP